VSIPKPAASSPSDVVSRRYTRNNVHLTSGAVLPDLTLAYETYGMLAPDGRNAVLITHGFTSSHHAAGTYRPGGAPRGLQDTDVGFWDKLIGPGKPIDTDALFVVSSNMLGSSYGSIGPRSLDPATGRPYGPDFPRFSVADIVDAQKALLEHLGVRRLVAVAGPSYGGYQAFQWAVRYPDFVDAIVPALTSPVSRTTAADTQALIDRLAADPNWNGGHYYENGGIGAVMTEIRLATLATYGFEAQLAASHPSPAARAAAMQAAARAWAEAFDGNSMVVLRRALEGFDTTQDFHRIRARVLYVLSRTDALFPPSLAPEVMRKLSEAGVEAQYYELDSDLGHLASGPEGDTWGPVLRAFLAEVLARR
jgi:homoserine O-acetyltransferase